MNNAPLTVFYSLKTNKSPGNDYISFNAMNNVFDFIGEPLRYIFSNSLVQGLFLEVIKFAQITPIDKDRDKVIVVNYRPISVLPWFPKILERIVYNKLYLYLIENNLLYNKQFWFQKGHSTLQIKLTNQIHEIFNKNIYTLSVFTKIFTHCKSQHPPEEAFTL